MMKKFSFCYVIFFLFNISIYSQAGISEVKNSEVIASSGEMVNLFTDRNIYCVDEKIYFTAEYSCIKELDTLDWSNVLYVELINWNGSKLAQIKLKLNKNGSSGNIYIPSNIISGNYYLRAYTKWMRNFSPTEYAYLNVKIVNPLRLETDEGPKNIAPNGFKSIKMVQKSQINGVSCSINKDEYKPREKAELELYIASSEFSCCNKYCLSVVKLGEIDTTTQLYEPESSIHEDSISFIEYLPEMRGITVSGEAIDKFTNLPIKEVFLNLSETKHGDFFSVYKTNNKGRFVFSLPEMEGLQDFFIQAENTDSKVPLIRIDNEFCSKPVKLPFISFELNENEKKNVKEMMINLQINKKFHENKDTLVNKQYTENEPITFYGSTKVVYKTENYIELPNIEEFINEIIKEVAILSGKGKTTFLGLKRENNLFYPPLILMDNIQVSNDDKLLKIPLHKIERIEIVNATYTVGGMQYCGIVSIYSKNKDFAGLDLNKKSIFFTFGLYSKNENVDEINKMSSNLRIPDRRNLLYWNPDIELKADKKTTISFYTSDIKGDYIVYIRGKNYNGKSGICGKCYFSVK